MQYCGLSRKHWIKKKIEDHETNIRATIIQIKQYVSSPGFLMIGKANNSIDTLLLRCFGASPRHTIGFWFREIWWVFIPPQWHKCSIDWVTKGNPGLSTSGDIFGNFWGTPLGCFTTPIRVQIPFVTELMAFTMVVKLLHVWTDSPSGLS